MSDSSSIFTLLPPLSPAASTNAIPPTSESAAWQVLAVHLLELRVAEVVDDAALQALALALQNSRESSSVGGESPRQAVIRLGQQAESRVPASVSGMAMLGLPVEDAVATVSRLQVRDALLHLMAEIVTLSAAAQTLAETHVVTIMPAYSGGQPVQPTTFAHFLGGVIGPLGQSRRRIQEAYAAINRSPMGSGMLAGDVVGADRDELAQRLSFDGPVANTLDALSSVEDMVSVCEAVASSVSILARFVRELRQWIRTDPTSFVMDEPWQESPEPGHPSLKLALRLDRLLIELESSTDRLDGIRAGLRRLDYGPLGVGHDLKLVEAITSLQEPLNDATELFLTGIVVNRAYLGNRAGRNYTTAPDLAAFLMMEEQIPPAPARQIAVLVLARLQDMRLEVSGITPDMIDSAALMTIGREIKVEMETLGRFLAPRRYIERRQVTGSPAPDMTRAWLDTEAGLLDADRTWLEITRQSTDHAANTVRQSIEAAAFEDLES